MTDNPDYISCAMPVPSYDRAPWYKNTAPSYAGVFLWIVFYQSLGGQTIRHAGLGVCLAALAVAGLLCHFLYYFAPAMLGMKTGYPLYVVGSSTFGSTGGYAMPGLLMGLLQIGWFGVGSFIATDFILKGLGVSARPGSIPFIAVGVVWGYTMAYVGVKGIRYVGRVALLLNCIPLVMLLVVFFQTASGIARYVPRPAETDNYGAFVAVLAIVLGFFATGGAAGSDFGMNSRNATDVSWGGLVGISLAAMIAGGLALVSVAGAHGLNPALPGYQYDDVVHAIGGPVATTMYFLFALASVPASCFCSFIIGNSFATMIPQVSRFSSTMIGATVGIILAVTGIAGDLVGFFSIVGASFGPICGAMAADYLMNGRRWAGPRPGINWAGYGAWATGFLVGILPSLPVSPEIKSISQPAPLYSFIVGFAAYFALAKAGLEPRAISAKSSAMASSRSGRTS
ncbi:MAG: cytosine permease [Bryobacteraceae bacterium]